MLRTLTLIWGLIALSGPALAAGCLATPDMLERLHRIHGESPLWIGTDGQGQNVIVTAAPDGGSYSVLLVDGAGQSCMIAAGLASATLEPLPAGVEQ